VVPLNVILGEEKKETKKNVKINQQQFIQTMPIRKRGRLSAGGKVWSYSNYIH